MCETTWNHWENPEEGFHEISFFIIAQYAFEGRGGVTSGTEAAALREAAAEVAAGAAGMG